jgi:hypothetical protein
MGIEEDRHPPDEQIILLRESIRRSFPARVYTGDITPNDGIVAFELTEDQAILDDDQFLYRALKGQQWTDVPREFLKSQPDGYLLLADEAFAAFLSAWLVCSLENIEGENEIREFLAYSFCETMRQFRLLNPEQRHTVRSMLAEFTQRGTVPFVREFMVKALRLIDLFEQYGEPGYLYEL